MFTCLFTLSYFRLEIHSLNLVLFHASSVKKLLQPFGSRTVKCEGRSPPVGSQDFWSLSVVLMLVSELQLQVDNPSDRTNGLLLRLLLLRLLLPPQSFRKKENICPPWESWENKSCIQSGARNQAAAVDDGGQLQFLPLSDPHTLLPPRSFNEVLALASGGSSCEPPAAQTPSELRSRCSVTLTEVVM